MISRRLIRIKVLQVLYAYVQKNEGFSSHVAEKELFHSIEKFYDLYHLQLLLLAEFVELEQKKIDLENKRNLKSAVGSSSKECLTKNKVIEKLINSEQLYSYKNERKLNWKLSEDFVKSLYNEFFNSDMYKEYYYQDSTSFEQDRTFVLEFYTNFLANNDSFAEYLEEENIYWNDDNSFALLMVVKSIENIKENGQLVKLLPLFKNEDDRDFAKDLIRKTIVNREEQLEVIQKYTKNWDTDRIAQIDLLILQLAYTEFVGFSSIPVKVTMNEFIEISKYYSTQKSNVFINGVLDKMVKELQLTNKINKKGRGLIG